LLQGREIVLGELIVGDLVRRNRNLRVQVGGAGYILKQPTPEDLGTFETISAEAAFYAFCENNEAAASVRHLLPPFRGYWAEDHVLALEYLSGVSLNALLMQPTANAQMLGRAIGRALGELHFATGRDLDLWRKACRRPLLEPPWIYSVHEPHVQALQQLSAANLDLVRLTQTIPAIASGLADLKREWSANSLIHGDVKADNTLFVAPDLVKLVDWELVQVGDCAWDVAGVFHDPVLAVVRSGSSTLAEERSAWLRAFGRSACGEYFKYNGDTESGFLSRLIRNVGARLIQTAFELSGVADALSADASVLLEMAAKSLADPATFAVHALGISPGWVLR
jgi:Ser/Thr protein kinase RdoA (MazF antagonist)